MTVLLSRLVSSGRGKLMYCKTRVVVWCSVAIVTAATSGAQIAPGASTIQSTATATIDVMPDYVEFWLHREVTADNFAATMVEVLEFGPELRKAISKDKLGPSDQLIMAPSIADINSGQVSVSAKLRFNMSAYTDHEAGPRLFAVLCDKMLSLSEQLECTVAGPFLEVDDRGSVEQTAQGRAIENAGTISRGTHGRGDYRRGSHRDERLRLERGSGLPDPVAHYAPDNLHSPCQGDLRIFGKGQVAHQDVLGIRSLKPDSGSYISDPLCASAIVRANVNPRPTCNPCFVV